MKLFDEIDRTDDGPKPYAEESFSYYNRSARQDVARIREAFEEWFSRYPADHQEELGRRFREGFNAPFFELLLHEVLLRLRCNVTVHPDLGSGVTTRPEFIIETPDGGRFVLEATVATDETREEAGLRKVQAAILDAINSMELSDFLLDVEPVRG